MPMPEPMDTKETAEHLYRQLDSRRIGRRQFVGMALKAGLSIPLMGSVLAACGDGATEDGGEEAAGTGNGDAAPASDTIRVLGIGVTLQDHQLEAFAEETGFRVEPVVDTLTGMLTKMLTEPDRYDAVDNNATYLQPMLDAGALAPIPVSDIENWQYARPLFTDPEAPGAANTWPYSQVYTDDSEEEFKAVPQYFNYEAMGYNADAIGDEIASYGSLFDPQYAGQVSLWNDALWTIGMTANYLMHHGEMAEAERNRGDLTAEEIDQVIEYLTDLKSNDQFRVFWTDYGQIVNLMASEEVLLSDGWNPAFEDAKAQSGLDLRYINPEEGNRPWFHALGLSAQASNPEGVAAFANWRLGGQLGAEIAPLGYYSPTTTVEEVMEPEDYALWYGGDGRFAGSFEERTDNVAFWPQWPQEYDHYLNRWSAFLAS